jgi:hypothetical protein
LRHNYLKRIEDHAKEVSEATSLRDLDELERTFEVDMKNDSKKLAEELWRAKIDAIFSKETLAVLAAIPVGIAAAHVLPFAIPAAVSMIGGPGAVAVGGILSANKYATNRRAILDKHPMAYLYELERHR